MNPGFYGPVASHPSIVPSPTSFDAACLGKLKPLHGLNPPAGSTDEEETHLVNPSTLLMAKGRVERAGDGEL